MEVMNSLSSCIHNFMVKKISSMRTKDPYLIWIHKQASVNNTPYEVQVLEPYFLSFDPKPLL